ncbi:MAG: sulfatase [Pirellulaceae bacterium]|nr:sulfatase [Pirellulaceae bacterium]
MLRLHFFCQRLSTAVVASVLSLAIASFAWTAEQPNVLFIAIDDLNDWVGVLGGNPQAKTPNIDKLSKRGVNFFNAHCASPVCNPSRTALMSGLRSSTSGVYSNGTDWRNQKSGKVATMNMHFKANGYYVAGAGKIYHESYGRYEEADWDDYYLRRGPTAEGEKGKRKGNPGPAKGESGGVGGIAFAPIDGNDDDLEDYHIVDYCIEQLQRKHDKPMFLACGIHKPHMPWYVPRKYYDMFPLESIQVPKVLESDLSDVPPEGVKMAHPDGDHAQMLKSGRWKEAVQGYLAAGAFCDAMVGRLMDAFDKSAYRDNTILVFWGDHGWHLGEKQHWRKFTLWEEATRAPLFFTVPGITKPGAICNRPVDFMCLYPTLCDLCNLPVPSHVESKSIRPLLVDANAPWSSPGITTHGYMNHSVRTEKWRYIRYANGGEELYDEVNDPTEFTNLASKSEFASIKEMLRKEMPSVNVDSPNDKTGNKNQTDPDKQALKKAKKANKEK